MENALQVFDYEGSTVRTIDINGEVWFVGKDVATVLGYSNTNDALIKHVDEEDKLTSRIAMAGQNRDVIVINESGVYSLIFQSKLPTAKKFKHWVTSEVLPQIHRTGSYNAKGEDRELRIKELDSQLATIDLERAKILQRMIDAPAIPLSEESKAVIQHEMFRLVTGHECLAMLPQVHDRLYTATQLGEMFGVSSKKIGKIAKAHGLKSEEGEPSEYGQWVLTKSRYSCHQCSSFTYNGKAVEWLNGHKEVFA